MEVTPGVTLANLTQATKENFEALVNSATFANGEYTDFVATNRPVFKGGGAPEPVKGQIWLNTSISGFFSLMYYDGSGFKPLSFGLSLTNKSGSSMQAGDAVEIVPNESHFDIPGTSFDLDRGILAVDTENDQEGPVIFRGIAKIRQFDETTYGTAVNMGFLRVDSSTGIKVDASSRTSVNSVIGRLLDKTNKIGYIAGRLIF